MHGELSDDACNERNIERLHGISTVNQVEWHYFLKEKDNTSVAHYYFDPMTSLLRPQD